jgi:hypothetical protein
MRQDLFLMQVAPVVAVAQRAYDGTAVTGDVLTLSVW